MVRHMARTEVRGLRDWLNVDPGARSRRAPRSLRTAAPGFTFAAERGRLSAVLKNTAGKYPTQSTTFGVFTCNNVGGGGKETTDHTRRSDSNHPSF